MSERTELIWEYIIQFAQENRGTIPTTRDIVDAKIGSTDMFGPISSTSVVHAHLSKLVEEGRLTRIPRGDNDYHKYVITNSFLAMSPNVIGNKRITDYKKILVDSALKNKILGLNVKFLDALLEIVQYHGFFFQDQFNDAETVYLFFESLKINGHLKAACKEDCVALITDNGRVLALASLFGLASFHPRSVIGDGWDYN